MYFLYTLLYCMQYAFALSTQFEWRGYIMIFRFVNPKNNWMSGSSHEWTGIFALSVLRLTVQNQIALVERNKVTSTKSH